MMMISGATVQTGPWPPLRVSWLFVVRCGLSAPRSTCSTHPYSAIRESSSNYQRLVAKQGNTGEKWPLNFADESYRARRVLLHAVDLRHGTDGFTSPPKEGVLRILSPLKSIVLGRVWTRDVGSSGKHANHYTADFEIKICYNQFSHYVNDVLSSVCSQGEYDSVYFDLSLAFDKIPYSLLLDKRRNFFTLR
jgi:hypothetical protein